MGTEVSTVNKFSELSKTDQVIYALGQFYAGFLTISEFNKFCDANGLTAQVMAEANEEVEKAIIAGIVPVYENQGLLSGTPGRKFHWTANEALFYTLGNTVQEIWINKTGTPESTVQALDESHGFASFIEEHGFIEFETLWVTRTVRDVYAVGTDNLTRILHNCVVAIPKPSSDEEFVQNYQAITSLDGGMRFYGKVTMTHINAQSLEKYGLHADNVFLLQVPDPEIAEGVPNNEPMAS
jgi:hypothetical protein